MANIKITDLTAYTDAASTDVLPIVDVSNDVTKKISISTLLKATPLGSAAAPAIAIDGDPNTGIYSPGADQVAISTGGTGQLFVAANGKVGIGTATPGARFEVRGGSGPYMYIVDDGANGGAFVAEATNSVVNVGSTYLGSSAVPLAFLVGGSEKARLDSSGRLGIGTATPNVTGFGSTVATINVATSSNGGLELTKNNVAAGHFTVEAGASNDIRVGAVGGSAALTFQTGGNERARIDSSGRLLVGTSTATSVGGASALTQIETGANIGLSILRRGDVPIVTLGATGGAGTTAVTNGANLGAIRFAGADGASIDSLAAEIRASVDGTPGTNDMPGRLVFSTTADGASSPTERMRIKSNGTINFSNVATYADNAAAIAGGLAAGDVYRTSTGQLMIRY
jgi:hypothetical protein